MKIFGLICVLVLVGATGIWGEEKYFQKMKAFDMPEAQQGVAVDDTYFYTIGAQHIAKYDKVSGQLVKQWVEETDGPITHLYAGEPSVGKLGLKLSAVKAVAVVFWKMATTVEEPDVPALPSGSNDKSVSLPF